MSTRATYLFKRPLYGRDVAVYIHHDGYPEGAAGLYLLPAIEASSGYLTAEAFIRANERAEITDGHEAHGDTEYRYTIDLRAGTVSVQHRNLAGGYGAEPRWMPEWGGSLEAFVNKYAQQFKPGMKVREHGVGRWMTAEMARAEAEQKAAHAADYRARFPEYTVNADYADREAAQAREFADSFAQQVAA